MNTISILFQLHPISIVCACYTVDSNNLCGDVGSCLCVVYKVAGLHKVYLVCCDLPDGWN